MKLFRRFEYLIPRFCILLLLLTAVWIAKDPLLRLVIVHQTQKLTSAKVEIQHLSSNWEDGQLFLKNVKIADARDPMSNLVQADLAYLKFNLGTLKERRLEIEEGRVIGLVFNAPRTESGALRQPSTSAKQATDPSNEEPHAPPAHSARNVINRKTAEQIGKNWINQLPLSHAYTPPELGPSTTVQNAFQPVVTLFEGQISEFSRRVEELGPMLQHASAEVRKETFPNPLRDRDTLGKSIELLEQWQRQASEIRQLLSKEMETLETYKQSLNEIATREITRIEQIVIEHPFYSEVINELFLNEEQNLVVDEILQSINHLRSALPKGEELLMAAQSERPSLDRTLRFPGMNYQPQFIVKKLELEGSGRFAERRINFVGTAYNLSSEPELTDAPILIELRALGKQNLMVSYTRHQQTSPPLESLEIHWPDLELPQTGLGHENSLLASISPGRQVSAKIVLEIQGEQLTGQIQLHHSQVAMHLDHLHELLGGNEIRLRLNQGLSQINQFKSKATLAGSLNDYRLSVHSDLGEQFVQLADKLLSEKGDLSKQQQKELVLQSAQGGITQIDKQWKPQLEALMQRLDQDLIRISELKSSLDPANRDGWSKIR